MLMTIAQFPEVRNRDAQACNKLFQNILKQDQLLSDLLATNPEGLAFAAGVPFLPTNLADRKHFQEVLKTRDFAVGEYIISRFMGAAVLPFAYPVIDSHDQLKAVVLTGFKLDQYQRFFNQINLPEGTVGGIEDYRGIRLFRFPQFNQGKETLRGKPLPDNIWRQISGPITKGTYFESGTDGIPRIYGFTQIRLSENDPPYLYIRVGIPEAQALFKARNKLKRNLLLLTLASILAAAAAWFLGNLIIGKRLQRLVIVSQEVAAGNYETRSGLSPSKGGELGLLAQSFDTMAAALEKRETESRQSQAAIQKLNDQNRLILQAAGEGIIGLNREGKVTFINPAAAAMTRYVPKELIGRDLHAIIHHTKPDGSAYPPDECPMYQSLSQGSSQRIRDEVLWRKDGTSFPSAYSSTPIMEHGEIIGAVVTFRDITERHQTEVALRESDKRYRLLFDNAADAIGVHDLSGKFFDVNQALCERLGYSRAELLQMTPMDIDSPADAALVPERIQEVVGNGRAIFETKHRRRDGTLIPVEVNCRLIEFRGQQAVFSIARDITERKQAEKEKAKLEAQLYQSQKMEALGTLAGGIAHDFNNILTAVLGFADMGLLNSGNPDAVRQNLQKIYQAGLRAAQLVKQILAFTRQAEQERQPVQVGMLIKETLHMLRASLPSNIEIRPNVQSTKVIQANSGQIHQVLMNLCTNAAHAMRKKGGTLEISLIDVRLEPPLPHTELSPGDYLKLSVSDSGHGIPPEISGKIFDPFFTTKESGEGTGLGLAVVHGIITNHRGAITVYSEPGEGTTFNIYLPCIDAAVTLESQSQTALPLGKERILWVDDEQMILELGHQMLERLGYEVVSSNSSLEALRFFQGQPDRFDLVITDQTMPQLAGLELSQKLLEIRPDLPIILCTGFSENLTADKAQRLGIKKFIMKPLVINEVARAVRKTLDNQS
jgi:PAS domain S-box-containing protein